jgi:hypothetical protein
VVHGLRCAHRRQWRWLRAKRGYSQFYCMQCKAKWSTKSSTKTSTEIEVPSTEDCHWDCEC